VLYRSIKMASCCWHLSGPLVLVAVTLLLAGCLTRRPAPAMNVRPVQQASFAIVDRRPQDERTTRWLSDVVYSCAFTVRQYGDGAISPDRFTLLTESLDTGLHQRLAGKVLFVTHFGIYVNSSQRSRAAASLRGAGLGQGLADYAAGTRFDRLCTSEAVAQGWLEAGHGDNTTRSVVIVQITFSVEGRAHSVRVFEDANSPRPAAAIVSAIGKASERIIADLTAQPGVITAEAR
jgi:hypothetical protein